jgi:hypothetical protein
MKIQRSTQIRSVLLTLPILLFLHVARAAAPLPEESSTLIPRPASAVALPAPAMRPMRASGNNHALDIRENFLERNCGFGRSCIQLREDCAGPGVRSNRPIRDLLAIICNPVRNLVEVFAKDIGRDVSEVVHRGK